MVKRDRDPTPAEVARAHAGLQAVKDGLAERARDFDAGVM
jgi:hypothetical protein